MPRRKPLILILFTVVIAIIALFAAGEVLAQDCVGPTCCQTPGDWTIAVDNGPYAVDPVQNGCTIPGSSPPIYVPCYQTDYVICKPGSVPVENPAGDLVCDSGGLNQLLFAVKVCSPDQIRFFPIGSFDPSRDIEDIGVGDPALNFLVGYLQAYVIRITPQPNGQWSTLADTPFTTVTTMALKAGKGRKSVTEFCEISGLDCPRTSSDAGGASSQCVLVTETTAGNIYMGVVRGPDGCSVDAAEVSFYIDSPNCDAAASCSDGIPATGGCRYDDSALGCDAVGNEDAPICIDPPEEGFQFCADFGGGCQECFEFRSGSPTCMKYTLSSGIRIKSCFLDDGTTCSWRKCCKLGEETPACGYP